MMGSARVTLLTILILRLSMISLLGTAIIFTHIHTHACMHTHTGGWGDIFGSDPGGAASAPGVASETGDGGLEKFLSSLPDLSFMLCGSISPPNGTKDALGAT